ncbi:hypothetical protein KDL45_08490, partial [bacterium]|nr:hypothetical protein [bacterium]
MTEARRADYRQVAHFAQPPIALILMQSPSGSTAFVGFCPEKGQAHMNKDQITALSLEKFYLDLNF